MSAAAIGVFAANDSCADLSHCESLQCAEAGVKIQSNSVGILSLCVSDNDRIALLCGSSSIVVDHFHASLYYHGLYFAAGCIGETPMRAYVRKSTFTSSHVSSCGTFGDADNASLNVSNCRFVGSEGANSRAYCQPEAGNTSAKQVGGPWVDVERSGDGIHVGSRIKQTCIWYCMFVDHQAHGVLGSGADVLVEGCHTSRTGNAGYRLEHCGHMQIVRCSSDGDKFGVTAARVLEL